MFLSLETPLYTNISLEKFVLLFQELFDHDLAKPLTIIFDEIQYLAKWEQHLKSLVDSFPQIKFIVSGSAAAALKLKSQESGAGRFTEFMLPPLTFCEYLRFIGRQSKLIRDDEKGTYSSDIELLNDEFINYLNIGGYPEAALNKEIREDPGRYIKNDIIDKVLLRDLPQLYGIRDIQELNRLFTTLAFNTANEVSLNELSKSSGVSKTTLIKYLDYLEAAFLIKRVKRIDQNAKRFKRDNFFKIYLTNPSMRSALFGTVADDDKTMGAMAETALFAQGFHSPSIDEKVCYARWPKGEIDMVNLSGKNQKPVWCMEIKWSDRALSDPKMYRHILEFAERNPLSQKVAFVTTKTQGTSKKIGNITIYFQPVALFTYLMGKNALEERTALESAINNFSEPAEELQP